MPTKSLTGCRCFLTFIDDFSRLMFHYVLKSRTELYDCFEDRRRKALMIFRTDVQTIEYTANHHDPKIMALRADNAKEYEKLGRMISSKYGTRAQFTNVQPRTKRSRRTLLADHHGKDARSSVRWQSSSGLVGGMHTPRHGSDQHDTKFSNQQDCTV